MVHTVNRVSKQVVTSLIIAGLFVASSLFIIHKVEPFWKGFSVLGISGMALSVFLTYGMLRDLRKGDHDDWKGWDED
jgi:ubiquinone biosynthesis protein